MCLPLAAVGIGLSLAGSALSIGQQQAAYSYQSRISARNRELATQSAIEQYGGVGEKLFETSVKAGSDQQGIKQDSLSARGRVAAAAAEAGVGGNSYNALIESFRRQEGEFISASEQNEKFVQTQAEYEKRGIRLGYEARLINSASPQRPNLWGEALGAFSSAFNTGLQIDSRVHNAGGTSLFF